MSCAVCHIVLMTVSSGTFAVGRLARSARVDAVIALIAPIVFRSMHGTCTSPADRIAGHPEVVLHRDLGGHRDLRGDPPRHWVSPAAAIALETPISAWQPPIAAEIVAPS